MNSEILDRIGDWNPQFYREVKGKLNRYNLVVTILISGLVQALLVFSNSAERNGIREVEWKAIFDSLDGVLPIVAIAIGVYLLSRDLCREKDRGTFDFIRLSPQPSEKFLLGKLLGVPILLYLSLALAFPLHLTTALIQNSDLLIGEKLSFLGAFYLILIVLCGIFYNFALLMALKQNPTKGFNLLPAVNSAISLLLTPIAFGIAIPLVQTLSSSAAERNWSLFFLPELLYSIWLLVPLFATHHFSWELVNRSFRSPNSSLMSKVQSYWLVCSIEVWFLGFALPGILSAQTNALFGWVFLGILFSPSFVLIVALGLSSPLNFYESKRENQGGKKQPSGAILREIFLEDNGRVEGAVLLNTVFIGLFWVIYFIAWDSLK